MTPVYPLSRGHIRLNISNQDRFEGPKRVQLVEIRPTGPLGVRFPQESDPKRPLAALIWHFLAQNPPLPPSLGGRAIFHSFSPFLVLLSPPKGKKTVPLGPQTIFWGGTYQNLHHTLLYVMARGKILALDRGYTGGGQGVILTKFWPNSPKKRRKNVKNRREWTPSTFLGQNRSQMTL